MLDLLDLLLVAAVILLIAAAATVSLGLALLVAGVQLLALWILFARVEVDDVDGGAS